MPVAPVSQDNCPSAPNALSELFIALAARLADEPARLRILQPYESVFQSPQPPLPAAARLGGALAGAGLHDEAETLSRTLAEHFPHEPIGFVGRAQLAMRQMAWAQALARWDEVFARFRNQ